MPNVLWSICLEEEYVSINVCFTLYLLKIKIKIYICMIISICLYIYIYLLGRTGRSIIEIQIIIFPFGHERRAVNIDLAIFWNLKEWKNNCKCETRDSAWCWVCFGVMVCWGGVLGLIVCRVDGVLGW